MGITKGDYATIRLKGRLQMDKGKDGHLYFTGRDLDTRKKISRKELDSIISEKFKKLYTLTPTSVLGAPAHVKHSVLSGYGDVIEIKIIVTGAFPSAYIGYGESLETFMKTV